MLRHAMSYAYTNVQVCENFFGKLFWVNNLDSLRTMLYVRCTQMTYFFLYSSMSAQSIASVNFWIF